MSSEVLVIGGNHGLGLEWVKYYLSQGCNVTATYRNKSASNELFAINNDKLTILECDVTNVNHIEEFAKKAKSADIYLYNAGTKGYEEKFIKPIRNTAPELELALKVNCMGMDAVIRAFFPKIIEKTNCLFVYMSTGVSSTQDNAGGDYHPYRISKAAGNHCIRNWDIQVTEQWLASGKDIDKRPLLFALTPGMVNVGMAAGVTGAMPVDQAIAKMVNVMNTVLTTKDTHGLWSYSGTKIENYVIPTVIKKHQAQQEQSAAKTYLPMLEKTKALETVKEDLTVESVLERSQREFMGIGLG